MMGKERRKHFRPPFCLEEYFVEIVDDDFSIRDLVWREGARLIREERERERKEEIKQNDKTK